MDIQEEQYCSLRLLLTEGLSHRVFISLVEKFGSAKEAVTAGPQSWGDVIPEKEVLNQLSNSFENEKRNADQEWQSLRKEKIDLVLSHAGPFPLLLKALSHPPPLLYVKGENISEASVTMAIVGSRRCSYYGEKMARLISSGLTKSGVTTVSGLARGIDSCVHQETIKEGGRTWAVLGSGLSICYPPENKRLFDRIAEQGALISEFPLNATPLPANFPRRNRIIAGLTVGTVVIEGTEKSGALITARLAAEEGREVYAVPGPVTSPLSAASHYLIQHGAKLVQKVEDILEDLPEPFCNSECSVLNEADEPDGELVDGIHELIRHLTAGPVSREELAQRLDKAPHELSPLLLELELKGIVKSLPGGLLVKA